MTQQDILANPAHTVFKIGLPLDGDFSNESGRGIELILDLGDMTRMKVSRQVELDTLAWLQRRPL